VGALDTILVYLMSCKVQLFPSFEVDWWINLKGNNNNALGQLKQLMVGWL